MSLRANVPPIWKLLLTTIVSFVLMAGCVDVGGTDYNGNGIVHPDSSIKLVVGGKLDTEAQILTKLYVLLLRHKGYSVTELAKTGNNGAVFNALLSKKIDLYPEFTTTGLGQLGLSSSGDPKTDYQTVKDGFERKYHIAWLDPAPLNDTYGLCALKGSYKTISQLKSAAATLTIATPQDALSDPGALPGLNAHYGFTFAKSNELVYDENASFDAVISGKAQLNVCYTTNPLIEKDNFALLQDDQHAFAVYNPAPILLDSTLTAAPQIADILNPLAPLLTNEISIDLQAQVNAGFTVEYVATTWLKTQGLL